MRFFFQEILGLEGSQNFLGKFRQVHNLKISDRLLGPVLTIFGKSKSEKIKIKMGF